MKFLLFYSILFYRPLLVHRASFFVIGIADVVFDVAVATILFPGVHGH